MLYLGYVGLSLGFAFAVAALIEGQAGALWARAVRPMAIGRVVSVDMWDRAWQLVGVL